MPFLLYFVIISNLPNAESLAVMMTGDSMTQSNANVLPRGATMDVDADGDSAAAADRVDAS